MVMAKTTRLKAYWNEEAGQPVILASDITEAFTRRGDIVRTEIEHRKDGAATRSEYGLVITTPTPAAEVEHPAPPARKPAARKARKPVVRKEPVEFPPAEPEPAD